MSVKLVSTRAIMVELQPLQENAEIEENSFSFDFNPILDEENENGFIIFFLGEQISHEYAYKCKVIFMAQFLSEKILTKESLTDNFLLINAPAIGYPYFRAFYSNFLLNAGYEPIILPTINFVKLKEEKEKDLLNKSST